MLRRTPGKSRIYHIRNVNTEENIRIKPNTFFPHEANMIMVRSRTAERRRQRAKSLLASPIERTRSRGRHKLRWIDLLKQQYMKQTRYTQSGLRIERERAGSKLLKTSTLP